MKQAVSRLSWIFVLLPMGLLAARANAALQQVTSVEGMTEYRLDNGLRVLLIPDSTHPTLTVNLTVLVGSRFEGYGESGMAHLLEHMLFKGTPTFPVPKGLLTKKGARWNGTTWLDRTNYFETVHATDTNLDLFIHFEADRLVNCPIRQEDLSTEMTVVRNEFEIGENNPGQVLFKHMQSIAYDWHNYGKPTIGNRSDIERVPADRLREFYKKYYQPDNAMLIVAGNFQPAKALPLIEKYFGPIPRPTRVLQEPYTEEPPQDGERSVSLHRVGEVGEVAMLYHVSAAADPQFAAVSAFADILTDAPSGPLYKALVETHKAASVINESEPAHDAGFLVFSARVPAGGQLDEVRQIMSQTIEQVAENGITEQQLERVKRRFASERDRELANTSALAVDLSNWQGMGDWRLFFLMRDRVEKLTPPEVQAAAQRFLRPSNRTVGVYVPSPQADRTPIPPPPDLTAMLDGYKGREAVAAGEQLDPDPMKIEARVTRSQLAGGIKVALLPKKSRQQMVVLHLTLRYGNERSLRGMREATEFLPRLMTRGSKRLSRQLIEDTLDAARATLNGAGEPGVFTFTLTVERPHLREALDVLGQVLREPSFPADEFEVLRRQSLAQLERGRSEPRVLAGNELSRKLNPYSADDARCEPTIDERIALLKSLSVSDVASLYAKQLGASVGELAVVGDFAPDELMPAMAKMLSGWESPVKYERLTYALANPQGTFQSIDTPDKANAVYVAGLPVPLLDSDDDYPALQLANHVLGGGASSRLWLRLREKEGFSYGTGSALRLRPLDRAGVLSLSALFNPHNAAKLRAAAEEEVRRLVTDGPEAAELDAARDEYLRERMLSRTDDGVLAAMLAGQLHLGRTMEFEATLEGKMRAVTRDQVLAAARKYIDPQKLTIIEAGDFAKSSESQAGSAPPSSKLIEK